MRALLLVLILVNLLFLAWATWIDVPVPGGARAMPLPALQVLAASSAPAARQVAAAPAQRCASFGPMPDVASASAIQAALTARQLGGTGRQAVGDELEGYWVRIENLGDAIARKRALQRLERAGVHGAEALGDSGQVSAGVFADEAAADKRAAAVRTAGFKPVVEPRHRAVSLYWIDVQLPTDLPLPAADALTAEVTLDKPPAWGACPITP